MATQPTDEYNIQCFLKDVDGQTVQPSQYSTERRAASVNFSAEVFEDGPPKPPSPTMVVQLLDEDSSGSEECSLISTDIEKKVDQMLSAGQWDGADLDSDWVSKELDIIELKEIDRSIQDRTMCIASQPPTNIRRRYQSDGKRQIERSRSSPMAIKLPDVIPCRLSPNQSFWLELGLITSRANPTGQAYIHVDKLEYHADNLSVRTPGFVCIPLTETDIQTGIKQLARVSIIKSKLDEYTFALIPYNPVSTDSSPQTYQTVAAQSVVAQAKVFRDEYQLQFSRIACQLLVKQDTTWYGTNILCETNIMEEKGKQSTPKKSTKRPAPVDDLDDSDEEYQVPRQSRGKKRKQSPTSSSTLPVTRVRTEADRLNQ